MLGEWDKLLVLIQYFEYWHNGQYRYSLTVILPSLSTSSLPPRKLIVLVLSWLFVYYLFINVLLFLNYLLVLLLYFS